MGSDFTLTLLLTPDLHFSVSLNFVSMTHYSFLFIHSSLLVFDGPNNINYLARYHPLSRLAWHLLCENSGILPCIWLPANSLVLWVVLHRNFITPRWTDATEFLNRPLRSPSQSQVSGVVHLVSHLTSSFLKFILFLIVNLHLYKVQCDDSVHVYIVKWSNCGH
jgi:hypothetical protein